MPEITFLQPRWIATNNSSRRKYFHHAGRDGKSHRRHRGRVRRLHGLRDLPRLYPPRLGGARHRRGQRTIRGGNRHARYRFRHPRNLAFGGARSSSPINSTASSSPFPELKPTGSIGCIKRKGDAYARIEIYTSAAVHHRLFIGMPPGPLRPPAWLPARPGEKRQLLKSLKRKIKYASLC